MKAHKKLHIMVFFPKNTKLAPLKCILEDLYSASLIWIEVRTLRRNGMNNEEHAQSIQKYQNAL